MAREILLSKKAETGLRLDPRTKLLLIFIISIFVMGGTGGEAMGYSALFFVPFQLCYCFVPNNLEKRLDTLLFLLLFMLFKSLSCRISQELLNFLCVVYNWFLLPHSSQRCNGGLCCENNNSQ